MSRPELPPPAGTLKNVRYAFAYNADAVYAGQSYYSLCVRNNESNHKNLQLGINETHALGKEFYVVANTVPHNAKLRTFTRDLKPVAEMGPDVLTMPGPGLTILVCEYLPKMPIHLPVQVNAVNWATVKSWQQVGSTRVILSHELSLEEIEEICNQVPDMEIEISVHGALCTTYSGRCLPSGYISKRDPNQGTCTSACHWEYNVQEGKEDDVGNIVHKYEPISVQNVESTLGIGAPTDKVFMIEEAQRPGEYMTAFEDEHGTYIMSSKDPCAIAHVERLTKMGVHLLEVEGHTKSFYYCARTAQVCRKAIDDAAVGRPFDTSLLKTLEGLAHHDHTEGSLRRHTHNDHQSYEHGYSVSNHQQFVGEFTGKHKGELVVVAVKSKFSVDDSLELMMPQGDINSTLEHMENVRGGAMSIVPGDGYTVWLPVPQDFELNYALLMHNLSGETTRNPHGKRLVSIIFPG